MRTALLSELAQFVTLSVCVVQEYKLVRPYTRALMSSQLLLWHPTQTNLIIVNVDNDRAARTLSCSGGLLVASSALRHLRGFLDIRLFARFASSSTNDSKETHYDPTALLNPRATPTQYVSSRRRAIAHFVSCVM